MEPVNTDEAQKRPEDDFDVAAELGRCIGDVLDLGAAQVATEIVAVDGGLRSAFIKLGPLTGPQIRDVRRRIRELAETQAAWPGHKLSDEEAAGLRDEWEGPVS